MDGGGRGAWRQEEEDVELYKYSSVAANQGQVNSFLFRKKATSSVKKKKQ